MTELNAFLSESLDEEQLALALVRAQHPLARRMAPRTHLSKLAEDPQCRGGIPGRLDIRRVDGPASTGPRGIEEEIGRGAGGERG